VATGGAGEKCGDDGSDFTVFVGHLALDVRDFILQDTFKSRYPSVKGAKVVFDRTTRHSKHYGFVKFGDLDEQTRAMTEMNGQYCSSRPMRLGQASNKKNSGGRQQQSTGMPASITYNVTCKEIYTYYLVCSITNYLCL
jgi:RNA recognition motif-containing protein